MKEKTSIEQLKKERDEYLAGWKRERADLANYKKEVAGYVEGCRRETAERIFGDLLAAADMLQLAQASAGSKDKENPVVKGFLQIAKHLQGFFASHGVREVETAGAFDPAVHEAVAVEEKRGSPPGRVSEVVAKGYTYQGVLLRPAKVKITK